MTVTIVALERRHLPAVMEHELDMFGTEAWSMSSYRDELADVRTRRYIAAESDEESAAGTLLGWAGVRVLGHEAEILTVGVVPSARRRGIARLMLDELLREAQNRGAHEVFLETRVDNIAAKTLYETRGFVVVGRRRGYYDHGRVDALSLQLILPVGPPDESNVHSSVHV